MEIYKYDIAFSLCKQDVDFARKLIVQLNPSINVFFYEDKQDELITKSGAEEFGKVFKEQARVVVIIARNEWSESFYTEIERNAIIDRTSVKNEGYNFLFVIPIEPNQIPAWYPSTRIYADPRRFSFEELAKFIEFKITDEGGIIIPLTLETRYQNLIERFEHKRKIVQIQSTNDAIKSAEIASNSIKDIFNNKLDFLNKKIFESTSWFRFSENCSHAFIEVGAYRLECNIIKTDELYNKIVTTQDYKISFQLFQSVGKDKYETIEKEQRLFYYSETTNGWATPSLLKNAPKKLLPVLFRNRDNTMYYDLKGIESSETIVDKWFQKLLIISSSYIENYL